MTTRTFRKLTTIAAATAALALALSGCAGGGADAGPASEEGDSEAITMGTQPWLGYGQWYVADDQGFFGDRGVDVELSSFNDDASVNAALVSKKLDMANVGAQAALQFIEEGLDVSIVLLLDSATDADAILSADGAVSSVSDLKGKHVAFERGATSEILLAEALSEAGLDFDDVEAVEASADQVAPMLLAGQVDAGVTYEPYISEAVSAGKGVETIATAGEFPGLITDVLVVRNEVLEERPEDVTEVLGAWDDAVAFYGENTDEARAIIAQGVGSSADDLETAFDGVHYYTVDENRELLTGDYLTETLPALTEAARGIGLVSSEIDAESTIRSEYLPE